MYHVSAVSLKLHSLFGFTRELLRQKQKCERATFGTKCKSSFRGHPFDRKNWNRFNFIIKSEDYLKTVTLWSSQPYFFQDVFVMRTTYIQYKISPDTLLAFEIAIVDLSKPRNICASNFSIYVIYASRNFFIHFMWISHFVKTFLFACSNVA